MLKMVNKICSCIEIKLENYKEKKRLIKLYADKESFIDVEAIRLHMKFTHDDICNIYQKRFYEEDDVVPIDEAGDWIKRCIIGNITKEQLDTQRQKEISNLDMLQNQSIIYHP